jgi:hypothetical protein
VNQYLHTQHVACILQQKFHRIVQSLAAHTVLAILIGIFLLFCKLNQALYLQKQQEGMQIFLHF